MLITEESPLEMVAVVLSLLIKLYETLAVDFLPSKPVRRRKSVILSCHGPLVDLRSLHFNVVRHGRELRWPTDV